MSTIKSNFQHDLIGCLCFKNLNILSGLGENQEGKIIVYRKTPPTEIMVEKLMEMKTEYKLKNLCDCKKLSLIAGIDENKLIILQIDENSGKVEEKVSLETKNKLKSVVLSKQGEYLATGDEQGQLRMYKINKNNEQEFDKSSLKLMFTNNDHNTQISKVDFHYDGNIISTVSQNNCFIYNIKEDSLELVKTITTKNTYTQVNFTLDDKLVLIEYKKESDRSMMSVWNLVDDIEKEKEVDICRGEVNCCQVSDEGLYLGIGTQQGQGLIYNLRYFDLESEKESHRGPVEGISFTNDSRFILTVANTSPSYHFLSLTKQQGLFAKVTKHWLIFCFLLYWVMLILQKLNII